MATSVPTATDRTSSMREAVSQARTEISKESEPGGTPPATPASDDAAAAAATAAAATPATAEEFLENATAEEIEAIRANPALNKLYSGIVRTFKEKTTKVAERAKALEERESELEQQGTEFKNARALFDAIRDNPKSVIKALAERNGMTIAEARAAVEETDEELTRMFGEDAPAVKPLFDKAVEKRAKAVVDASLGPIIEHLNEKEEDAEREQINADMAAFRAELKANKEEMTPEIEKEMIKLSDVMEQGEGLSTKDYVRNLYLIVTGRSGKARMSIEVRKQMEESLKEVQPAEVPSGHARTSSAALDPKLSLRESLAVARRDVRQGR